MFNALELSKEQAPEEWNASFFDSAGGQETRLRQRLQNPVQFGGRENVILTCPV